jgi:hypothetical protein
MRRLRIIFIAVLVAFPILSHAVSTVAGQYQGSVHGYLVVKPTDTPNRFKVWLGVGGGSCGGEVLVRDKVGVLKDARIKFLHSLNKRACTTTIEFVDEGAYVSDTCIPEESEASSTCAMMGEYEKISK